MDIPFTVKPRPDTGLYNAKVGIWLFLASEVMLFGALFSTYILLRVGAPEGTWPHGLLNVYLGTANTFVLITSSITVVMAWVSLKEKKFDRYKAYQAVTLLMAVTFLVIKSFEYRSKFDHYDVVRKDGKRIDGHLVSKPDAEVVVLHDVTIYEAEKGIASRDTGEHEEDIEIPKAEIVTISNWQPKQMTYLAIYFTMTGLHGLHVLGGALVIAYIWGPGRKMWKTDPERYTNRVEVTGLFWHFVDLVWIFLFPVLYLL